MSIFRADNLGFFAVLVRFIALLCTVALCSGAAAKTPAADSDPTLSLAEDLVGKALFLRGFYTANEVAYDGQGHLLNAKVKEKTQDWTLSAVNILKARRHSGNEIRLDGVRVAIRYNADAHQFERHPSNDEAIRITIATVDAPGAPAEAQAFDRALANVFSIGIDPGLQHSTPEFWQHYFDPALAWPKDALTDTLIITPGQNGQNPTGLNTPTAEQMKTFVNPIIEHRENAKFTDLAVRDKINGEIDLRLVVDTEGVPRRIAIVRPIGYGLDARAVESVAKWRFHPATLEGKPIAATIIVREQFDVPAGPHP